MYFMGTPAEMNLHWMHSLKVTGNGFCKKTIFVVATSKKKGGENMNEFKLKLLKMSGTLCSFALVLATVLVPGCRSSWYQPKEPDNLKELLKK